jgi:hypothetical protein
MMTKHGSDTSETLSRTFISPIRFHAQQALFHSFPAPMECATACRIAECWLLPLKQGKGSKWWKLRWNGNIGLGDKGDLRVDAVHRKRQV